MNHGLKFEDYCACHRTDATRYAAKLCGNKTQAEDIVQDALFRAYQAWHRFEPGDDPHASGRRWLLHIVFNRFVSTYNKKNKENKRLSQVDNVMIGTYGDLEPTHRDPRNHLNTGIGDEVRAAVDKLPIEFREVIIRCDLGGQSYKQVAEEMGTPLGTVMSRLHRARKSLKPLLTGYAEMSYRIVDEPDAEGDELVCPSSTSS